MAPKGAIPVFRQYRFSDVNNRGRNTRGRGGSPAAHNQHIRLSSLSSDSRRHHEGFLPVIPPQPVASTSSIARPEQNPTLRLPQNDFGETLGFGFPGMSSWFGNENEDELDGPEEHEEYEEHEEDEEEMDVNLDEETEPKRKKSSFKENPFLRFKEEAPLLLEEIMRMEERGGMGGVCPGGCNGENEGLYRCQFCDDRRLLCKGCIVARHANRPLDKTEAFANGSLKFWNGAYFERVTLRELGLAIQMGHPPGERCKFPRAAREGFVVVDLDFIQRVDMSFCGCQHQSSIGSSWQQLFRAQLFPATLSNPHTVFTFRALRLLHGLTLQGKLTTYHFYQSVEVATDAAGITDAPKGRYDELTRVMRVWRYLRVLKRGGIGCTLEPELDKIPAGALAVKCPACPRPNINLPENWKELTGESRFLFYKFISVDACFRLKRRLVSSEQKDPGLFTGKAYFVEQGVYQKQLEVMKDMPEEKIDPHCTGNNLSAIEQAYTKFRKGYATTGCILCLCARHEIVEPNGVADLDVGEKFWHTDYAISASQQHSDPALTRVLSYDICCQYRINFFDRLAQVPPQLQMQVHPDRWRFVVPKLHIKGHGRDCQEEFAFHLLFGGGQTDGEGIERQWASLGPIGTSTREMGPGHRRDTVDDHIGAWGWRKVVALGFLLRKKRAEARIQKLAHDTFFEDFTQTQSEHAPAWRKAVDDWEDGKSDKNPYSTSRTVETEQDVKLVYAQKEHDDLAAGNPFLHNVSPSEFMMFGLNLEDQQRRLLQDIRENSSSTPAQQSSLLRERGKIQQSLGRLRGLQKVYTPAVLTTTSTTPDPTAPTAEAVSLLLPSSLPAALRNLGEMQSWVCMEIDFRRAQLQSSLEGVRTQLFVQSRLNSQQSLHVRGQRGLTRAKTVENRCRRKLLDYKQKYRAAWLALLTLVGARDRVGFRWLADSDVVGLHDPDAAAVKNPRKRKRDNQKPEDLIVHGESRRKLTWIWAGVDVSNDSEAMKEAVRIEWCKAYARKRRWTEELALVEEEMRRVPLSLEHEAQVWEGRNLPTDEDPKIEAINAYSSRQAAIRQRLSERFQSLWALPDPIRRSLPTVLPRIEEESEEEDSGEEMEG
ncbi:hypothetical protein V5O48_015965 [Marasmius crinis-equi]|uniref:CxC2-like cysteine cluster KDZ transposase-associated domain-containing protein n=1 Tax=Marasmius crinis-equi TaxID=585013 RepID=A0ABR3ET20_9AGAR